MLLYDSTLRVPLIVAAPARASARRTDPVSLADVAPTILAAAGVTAPVAMTGRNLLAPVRPNAAAGSRGVVPLRPDVYAETDYPRVAGWSPLQALTDGRWKTIRAGVSSEVYDLQNDPAEAHDLGKTETSVAAAMTARIDAIRGTGGRPAKAATISDDAAERLRALGYVAGGTGRIVAGDASNPRLQIAAWNAFEDALSALNAKRPQAVIALGRLADSYPNAPLVQMTYARALKDRGDVTSALAVYRAAATRWPTDAMLLHDLAVASREAATRTTAEGARALRDEAARAERAALALTPGSAASHNSLGLIAIDDDRWLDALTEFERATTIDPDDAAYWVNLGNARRAQHDAAGAEQAYRHALDIDPRAADAANGVGVLLVEANRAPDAAPWFEQAIAAAPDFVEARLNLGIARQQAGDTRRAAESYRTVLAAAGGHAREKQAAARLLAALGAVR